MSLENSQNKILVCVPAFNAKDSIRETLKSILIQTEKSFDILVVDNCSTDNTAEIVKNLKKEIDKENRIYVFENKENIGRVGNWNQCLKIFRKTSHAYIKFVFTGDTLEKNCLQELCNVFQEYPQLGFVASGYYIHYASGMIVEKISFKESRYFYPLDALRLFFKNGNWVGAPVSCMFSRKAAWSQNFSEHLEWTADWKFCIDIASSFSSFYTAKLLGSFHASQRKHYTKYNANFSTRIKDFYMRYYAVQMMARSVIKQLFSAPKRVFYFLRTIRFHFFHWFLFSGNKRYSLMQKFFYNDRALQSAYALDGVQERVVGSYTKHNEWKDYDTYLMKYVDSSYKEKFALDFGCGPGRNIIKYAHWFKRLDGVDISEKNIENAKKNLALHGIANSTLYVNNGVDLESIPSSFYGFVMSTICMQHICVYNIRYNLLKEFFRVLQVGGRISIQMGYGKIAPDSVPYEANNVNAITTNRGCDTRVESSEQIQKDLSSIGFKNFEYWIRPTGPGDTHPNWIFFTAIK